MMYVIYNHDGSIKESNINEFIQQGSNNVNEFAIKIDGYNLGDYAISATFTLLNGEHTTIVSNELTTSNEYPYPAKKLKLTNAETALAGTLKMNIQAISGSTVLTSYTVYLQVNEGVDESSVVLITQQQYQNLLDYYQESLNDKVDKVEGMGLSHNDFTDTYKNQIDANTLKLSGIAAGAQVNVLDGVQVDGTDLPISNKKVNVVISGKADKVADATDGNLASLDENGNLEDSGYAASDIGDLDQRVDNLENIGRFLSLWNATTGEAVSNPPESPYTYKTGDYFRVSVGGTRIVTGSSYVIGETNYTTSQVTLGVGDVLYYDGTNWQLQTAGSGGQVVDVQIAGQSAVAGGIANIECIGVAYHPGYNYDYGEYVIYNAKIYKCISAGSDESWNSSHWEEVLVTSELERCFQKHNIVNESSLTNADLTMLSKGCIDGNTIYFPGGRRGLFPNVRVEGVYQSDTERGRYSASITTQVLTKTPIEDYTSSGVRLFNIDYINSHEVSKKWWVEDNTTTLEIYFNNGASGASDKNILSLTYEGLFIGPDAGDSHNFTFGGPSSGDRFTAAYLVTLDATNVVCTDLSVSKINKNGSGGGLILPSTSGYGASDKTLATTDQMPKLYRHHVKIVYPMGTNPITAYFAVCFQFVSSSNVSLARSSDFSDTYWANMQKYMHTAACYTQILLTTYQNIPEYGFQGITTLRSESGIYYLGTTYATYQPGGSTTSQVTFSIDNVRVSNIEFVHEVRDTVEEI